MIVVDTNVVSELMKAAPEEEVRSWSAGHSVATLYTTSLTEDFEGSGLKLINPWGR
jgi:predicted nucleic acid-binding protein